MSRSKCCVQVSSAFQTRSRRHVCRGPFGRALERDARRLKLIEVVDTLARTVKMEMDFRLEAAAASELPRTSPRIRICGSANRLDRTAKEVLTLEWIDGTPLSDIKALVPKAIICRISAAMSSSPFCAPRCGRIFPCRHAPGKFVRDPQGA